MSLIVSEVYDALIEAGATVERPKRLPPLSPSLIGWLRGKNSRTRRAC